MSVMPFLWGLLILLLIASAVNYAYKERQKLLDQVRIAEESETKAREVNTRLNSHITELRARYAAIQEDEATMKKLSGALDEIKGRFKVAQTEFTIKTQRLAELDQKIRAAQAEIIALDTAFYPPKFELTDTKSYQDNITALRAKMKDLIAANKVLRTPAGFVKAVGPQATALRAFNLECDNALTSVRWNTLGTKEALILKEAQKIAQDFKADGLRLADVYVQLRVDELHLVHGQRVKEQEEKEAAQEAAREERENKKALADAEAARKREEAAQEALRQAQVAERIEKLRQESQMAEIRKAMLVAAEAEREKYAEALDTAYATAEQNAAAAARKIASLESDLKTAHDAAVRTAALATRTKTGYVYVISNIGSFGEDVINIGMTRSENPDERVRELGDASVPFLFDTHAMIYSDDAPALEAALHRAFDDRRVNTENRRKEFFRVSIAEVEAKVRAVAPDAVFRGDREAAEWRRTLEKRGELIAQR